MKIPQPFTIYDLRFTIAGKSRGQFSNRQSAIGNRQCRPEGSVFIPHSALRTPHLDQPREHESIQGFRPARCPALNRQSSIVNRQSERGIALVITLIMLAITLVMAVAFLALAHRERASVTGQTDITTARLASDTAQAAAEGQIMANILNGLNGLGSSNAYNLSLLVSTNYINPLGFNAVAGVNGSPNPTNVNYNYTVAGALLAANQRNQNISNLWFLPRVPVCVPTNQPVSGYDFRYYLDLNQNGRFEPNGWQTNFDASGNILLDAAVSGHPPVVTFQTGDPEWVGILEHPDAPHGPNNHFIARYAFIAVPVGNTLDVNYIHNQAQNVNLSTSDGYMRNQGVGAWEINLAAFLADLNTNLWSPVPLPANLYYTYNEPFNNNSGYAFDDARSLLKYRYNFSVPYVPLPPASSFLRNTLFTFPVDGIDAYSDGPLQTTLNTNADAAATGADGDRTPTTKSWSGADNPNHYFTPSDFFDAAKLGSGANTFPGRLSAAGNATDTYDRYTYYRMLNQLGTDSSAEDGKLNLNYCNIDTNIVNAFGVVTNGISVIPGAETNLVRWTPQMFFLAAADQLLRAYTTDWYGPNGVNYRAFTNSFAVTAPFGITNIPVWVSNRFVYTPAVNRLLQLAANIYDATTNGNGNFPHVFRPVFKRVFNGTNNDIFIIGYAPVTYVSDINDRQLSLPRDVTDKEVVGATTTPIMDPLSGFPVNVYGVPWIIGAKKGLPNFNQLSMVNSVHVERYLQLARALTTDKSVWTNHLYLITGNNNLSASFWNSYSNNYPTNYPGNLNLTVYLSSVVHIGLTNSDWSSPYSLTYATNFLWTPSVWPGSKWGTAPGAAPNLGSFLTAKWTNNFIPGEVYKTGQKIFVLPTDSDVWEVNNHSPDPLPQLGLATTNLVQAFILDNHNVIDYVQMRGPIESANLNRVLQDPNYADATGARYLWSTNAWGSGVLPSWGIANQIDISTTTGDTPPTSARWNNPPNPTVTGMNPITAAQKFLGSMLDGTFKFNYSLNGQLVTYYNNQLAVQAGYTATRTAYSSYLLQANDPLVHYLASDLNAQPGTWSFWSQAMKRQNGVWLQTDDPAQIPTPPLNPVGGRYQPWLQPGQMETIGGLVSLTNNYAAKDSLVKHSDNWDFPTNQYPTVGWLGRVHRGTPWQTVYLKDADVLRQYTVNPNGIANLVGTNTWANWTGDVQPDYYTGQYIDAARLAPVQDRLLFDTFTTRLNDNSVRGTVPVNVGAGSADGGLAAWSALFGGMVTLSNTTPVVFYSLPCTYTNLLMNPAGVDAVNSPLWKIVNGVNGINATRANTALFTNQTFAHVGDILATPALTTNLLNLGSSKSLTQQQVNYGISDEMYEWLPQQMMGLVRASEPRYVLYCFGQALRPAPNGTVLSGPFSLLVTNYQVVAESAVRAVIRVDNANTASPHPVVETSNVLPPN